MSAELARLFVAVELPAPERAALAQWGAQAARTDPALRALGDEALHVTLHFLGSRPVEEVPGIAAVVRECADLAAAGVCLRLAGSLWLTPRRPHVLTCALSDVGGALGALHAGLAAPLATASPGWTADRRSLRPHVTVARVRRGARPRAGDEPPAPDADFTAPAVALMRSHLGSPGARYEALTRALLPA